ncbi:hypothetical protein NQ315_014022 [Exocentrus adspersus]|uniref:Uncharacterized protein n=1 Tax=Exocentrus adspersus TaxID=1586481 RepID=A0AAV8VBY1_9CUCU|nr:hypothetical protein NQ315_014022 [Exocentrus adspersus]
MPKADSNARLEKNSTQPERSTSPASIKCRIVDDHDAIASTLYPEHTLTSNPTKELSPPDQVLVTEPKETTTKIEGTHRHVGVLAKTLIRGVWYGHDCFHLCREFESAPGPNPLEVVHTECRRLDIPKVSVFHFFAPFRAQEVPFSHVYFIDREPAHLFLDKTIWRLEKGTKVTDSKHGFKGCLLFENWRGLTFA